MKKYTTWGSVRGCCNHEHTTPEAANKCIEKDNINCLKLGGYSDRNIRLIDRGTVHNNNYYVNNGPGEMIDYYNEYSNG